MFTVIGNIFRIPELRKKILFTLFILVVYRIGAHIPIPGINIDALQAFFEQASKGATGGLLNFFDLFAGGALKRFTIFALGIMPYISSSIILQLLTIVIPSLEKLSKEGPEGRKKIQKYTKYLTVVLCLLQSFGIVMWMRSIQEIPRKGSVVPADAGIGFFIIAIMTITTGTMILLWLGEMITEFGIGNGVSLIIFAGIVVRLPAVTVDTLKRIIGRSDPIIGVILVIVFLGVVAASILLTLGRRNIPVQYGKRMVGQKLVQGSSQSIPLPINAGNVIPIIFASSILLFPAQITNMLQLQKYPALARLEYWLSPGQIPYMVVYSGLIIFFCFFYAAIQYNPKEIAENLKKYQGFIPGIRPGNTTSEYIMYVLNRITLSGSLFLAFIAIVPDIVLQMWPEEVSTEMAFMFGGTSLLIIVGVALDTLKQIESQLLMRHYDGFFKKVRLKGRR